MVEMLNLDLDEIVIPMSFLLLAAKQKNNQSDIYLVSLFHLQL